MIIDHFGIAVSDPQASKAFYTAVLASLGITLLMDVQGWVGFGRDAEV